MPTLSPLPDCEGPKLHPYKADGTPNISFLDLIGQGAHGFVFKVEIDGRIFALKVFKRLIVYHDWLTANEELWDKVDLPLLTAQWRPFHAECRAYARLKEAQKEHLAARCYGYVQLTDAQKKELETRFAIDYWWGEDDDLENLDNWDPASQQLARQEEQRPLHGIIKEFIQHDSPFGPQHAYRMLSDLRQLHRCGIVVWDVNEDAYANGKLVDFSKAVVAPHTLFDQCLYSNSETELDKQAKEAVYTDLSSLGSRFEDWNDEHEGGPQIACRPLEEGPLSYTLRGAPQTKEDRVKRCFNPRKVDWKKFSKRSRASDVAGAEPMVAAKQKTSGKKTNGVSKRKVSAARKRK